MSGIKSVDRNPKQRMYIIGKDGIGKMFKRIVLGTLLIGLIGVLVAGAIIRTVDKTENVAEARGLGQGRGESEAGEA